MPGIADLFRELEPGIEDDSQIDIDKVLASVTDVLNDRSSATGLAPAQQTQADDETSPVSDTEPDLDALGAPDEVGEGDDGVAVEELPPAPPAPVVDPLSQLPPERRAALLALDETIMADPAKRAAVFGILSGDSEAPVTPKASLPDHIDPDSFEANLWREQQDQRGILEQIAQQSRDAQAETIQQRARQAATEAGNRFAAKYAEQLSQEDVVAIAQFAGQSGITASFASTAEARRDPTVAFEQALEHTLWTNEGFRAKVLGTSGPVPQPGDAPAAQERKRKLTALSPAASPVAGPAPGRSPIEHGVDGKLTEKSRSQVVTDAANMLRQSSGGI